jgi:hypothetical protein
MSERQIDEAIDVVVRDLMNVDADPAFRARVVERLRRPKPRGSFWRQLSMAAAALVVIIGVVVMRDSRRPAVERGGSTPLTPAVAQPQVAASREARQPAPVAPAPQRIRRDVRRQPTQTIARGALVATVAPDAPSIVGQDAPPTESVRLEPLAPIRPIVVTPLAADPGVVVTPLAPIADVQLSTLDPRSPRH